MKRGLLFTIFMLTVGFFICIPNIYSENKQVNIEELKEKAPKVFIDCRRCDMDYIRTEITYVNYVRDRKEADVHVLVTEQRTGSGGQEYTFAFIGLKEFTDMDNTLIYASGPNDTRDEIRRAQVEVLERGFFPYVIKTPIANYIYLNFRQKLEPTAVKDPWKFWVFSISVDGRFSAEQSRSSHSFNVNVSANKVTPDVKIRLGLSGDFDEMKYDYEDETITSTSDEKNFTGMMVKSISGHWSVGGWVEASASTYRNLSIGSL